MRSAGNFVMELKVRTLPDESFACFSPEDSMINVSILSMQMNRTADMENKKETDVLLYMWTKNMKVSDGINSHLDENFSVLLYGRIVKHPPRGRIRTNRVNFVKLTYWLHVSVNRLKSVIWVK